MKEKKLLRKEKKLLFYINYLPLSITILIIFFTTLYYFFLSKNILVIILGLLAILLFFCISSVAKRKFVDYILKLRDKKKKENIKLLRSNRVYKSLFERNKSIILLIDIENGNIIDANRSACKFYGYSRDKLLTMNISDINSTLTKEKIMEEMKNAIEYEKNHFNFSHKLGNGEFKDVIVTSSPINYQNKTVLFSVVNDITNEKHMKKELEQSEEQFKTLFDFINIGLGFKNKNGDFIKVNKKLCQMLGYDESYFLNRNFRDISTKECNKKEDILFKKLINKEISNYSMEKFYIKKDGTTFNAILTMTSMLDENKNIKNILFSIIDITKIKEKDRLLAQQSKMALMGEMIGNIAHQWKQPLSLISMSNTLLKMSREQEGLFSDEQKDEALDNIDNSVTHLNETIDDFRNFFKPDKEKKYFDIKKIYEKMYRLIKSQFENNNIKLIPNIDNIELYGYPNEILQVLINIIKNAKDELCKDDSKMEKLIFIDSYKKDNLYIIKIKDNAGGIPKEIIGNIFDPYFTTKEEENGTGIGLYMSKQIIDGMDGRIKAHNVSFEYDNKRYTGAEFIIEFKG